MRILYIIIGIVLYVVINTIFFKLLVPEGIAWEKPKYIYDYFIQFLRYLLIVILLPLCIVLLIFFIIQELYEGIARKVKKIIESKAQVKPFVDIVRYQNRIRNICIRDIPFIPDESQIIYIEARYHEYFNDYIKQNIKEIERFFALRGLHFIYMPEYSKQVLSKEKVQYSCPWIAHAHDTNSIGMDSQFLKPYINKNMDEYSICFYHGNSKIGLAVSADSLLPGFIYFKGDMCNDAYSFSYYNLKVDEDKTLEEYLDDFYQSFTEPVKYMTTKIEDCYAGENFDDESRKIMDEIKERVDKLRSIGVDEMIIRRLFVKENKLSRLHVTKDYHIFLTDYNNMEISMTALPKAVFLLFLAHPEGIIFKDLSDYREELASIYNKLTNRTDDDSVRQSIEDVTNPTKNSINEKCARIREAFIARFCESLAENYYITGFRAGPKKILLPRDLVIID